VVNFTLSEVVSFRLSKLIAIAIPLAIIGWLISSRRNKQVQKGGDNSTNIQIGGNFNLGGKKDDD